MLPVSVLDPKPIPREPPSVATGRVTEAEAQAMLRAVLTLFDKWDVSKAERLNLLGSPSERTFQRWRAGAIGPLPNDTVYRLGDLLGIHKALRYMFTDIERAYAWVKHPNAVFGGQSALALMLEGPPSHLAQVRAYLDAERGGW